MLAARAALRVLALVQTATHHDFKGDVPAAVVLPTFRATGVAWSAAKYPDQARRLKAADSARAADALVDAHFGMNASSYFAVIAAASAASAAAFSAAAYYAVATAASAADSASAIAPASVVNAATIRDAISRDATRIENGERPSDLARLPLWPEQPPREIAKLWQELKRDLLAANQDWEVWINWYEDRLAGRVREKERELTYALIDNELWEQGPAVVNAEIKRRIANPWIDTLAALPEAPLGNKWTEAGDRLAIDPSGDKTDDAAALDPIVCQLHEAVRRKTITFAKQMAGVDERTGWIGFEEAIKRLHAAVDVDTVAIPSRIATVYDATIEFASFLEFDNELRQRWQCNVTPLNPAERRAFEDLVRTAAPWIRRFPTACTLDDETGALLRRPDLFEPARKLMEGAGQAAVISEEDRDHIIALLSAAEHPGFPAEKAGTRGIESARNLATLALTAFVTFYSGAVASDFSTRSPLVQKISTFLAAQESQVTQIMSDRTVDIRLALASLLKELKHPRDNHPSSTQGANRYAIVDSRRGGEDQP